jgi:hypothetical protein
VSGPHPPYSPQDRNRLTSSLSHSVIPSSPSSPSVTKAHDSDEERGGFGLSSIHPPPMSYSSTSTLSDSVVTTPAFAAFPLLAESQVHSSARTTAFPVVIESSSSASTAGSEPLPDLHYPTIRARLTKSSQPTNTPRTRQHRSNLALR